MAGKSALKQYPDFSLERRYQGPVCGIDEAGRGPLAGPVVACCVHIPKQEHAFLSEVNDSKKLSAKKRNDLFVLISKHCASGIGICSPEEIDVLNIHNASLLAMRRAYHKMLEDFNIRPEAALVDGRFNPDISCQSEAVTKGDSKSISIAAASILAKVTRDNIMMQLHKDHPVYGWERNAGYGTPEHLNAIRENGVTVHHRQSFAPVRNATI